MRVMISILLTVFFGCQSNTELPVLSYKIDAAGNKTYYGVSYENFTNQHGESFTSLNISDKVFIANFFFTRCPSICPPMREELIQIAETFKNDNDFLIISHTIDPENDTISVLKNYAETTEVPFDKWQFLRASTEHTRKQANTYMTNFRPNSDGTDFYHSSYVALVDKDKFIRGYYNILVKEETERLKKDIQILLN